MIKRKRVEQLSWSFNIPWYFILPGIETEEKHERLVEANVIIDENPILLVFNAIKEKQSFDFMEFVWFNKESMRKKLLKILIDIDKLRNVVIHVRFIISTRQIIPRILMFSMRLNQHLNFTVVIRRCCLNKATNLRHSDNH